MIISQRTVTKIDLLTRVGVFGLSSFSILSLLLYFQGLFGFDEAVRWLLLPEVLGVTTLAIWAHKTTRTELQHRIIGGLYAGALATLVYDLSRVPISTAGVPVFKAISYFGSVLVGTPAPTPFSEVLGWTYHLSNGISFGLMYAAMVNRPGPVTAVAWGLGLEGAMLLTPYAEVFGYSRDARFLTITIWAHIAYGLGLWWGLRMWLPERRTLSLARMGLVFVGTPLVIGLIAADFYGRHAHALGPSPPPYIGKHLYTTWDVPEPDRVSALWILRRFVDPEAQFHFVPPFTAVKYGQAFDVPEGEIRRSGANSASETIVAKHGLDTDSQLWALATMTHLAEVTPWMLPSDDQASLLAQTIREATERICGRTLTAICIETVFPTLDQWYQRPEGYDMVRPTPP